MIYEKCRLHRGMPKDIAHSNTAATEESHKLWSNRLFLFFKQKKQQPCIN